MLVSVVASRILSSFMYSSIKNLLLLIEIVNTEVTIVRNTHLIHTTG
jgi:hypothetical protein